MKFNSSGEIIGYYKREIKYHDGKITGDTSEGVSNSTSSSTNEKKEFNPFDKAEFWIDPDETWWLRVGDTHLAPDSKTAWFDDHLVAYYPPTGAWYLLPDYKNVKREEWHDAELVSSNADAVWYKRSNGKFNVIEKRNLLG